jgi:hypothetical protein
VNASDTDRRRKIGRVIALAAALLVAAATAAIRPAWSQEKSEREPVRPQTLWIFFGPTTDLTRDLRELGAHRERHPHLVVRPCLLTDDFAALREPPEALARTVSELRFHTPLSPEPDPGLRVLDEEGLALARQLGVGTLPAWALVDAPDARGMRRARLAEGHAPRLKELLGCTHR